MTKPANFPGRKNARRIRALARNSTKINKGAAVAEALALHKRILPQAQAEAIRTKKDRRNFARIRSA